MLLKMNKIEKESIIYCLSNNRKIDVVFVSGKKIMVRGNLTKMWTLFEGVEKYYLKTRHEIINCMYIKKVGSFSKSLETNNYGYQVTFRNGDELIISKNTYQELRIKLKSLTVN